MKLFVYIIVILLSINYLVADNALITTPKRVIDFSDFLGIGAQFIWFNESIIKRQIQYLDNINIKWVRVDVHFDYLEPTKGDFRWSLFDMPFNLSKSMNIVAYLAGTSRWISSYDNNNPNNLPFTDCWPPNNFTLYAERMVMLANRYPYVKYWELWNEMNLVPAFWAPTYDPTTYSLFYKEVLRVFKLNGLENKLMVGSMGYYGNTDQPNVNMIEDLVKSGNNPYTNTVGSYHPYTEFPEGGQGQAPDSTYGNFRTTDYLNSKLREYGSTQAWSTEWGWSTFEVSEFTQAQYTIKRLLMDTCSGFNKSFIFTVSDLDARASSERDQHYGLVDLNLNAKPVYGALKRFLKVILSESSIGSIQANINISNTDETMVFIQFQKVKTNTSMIAFWTTSTTKNSTINISGFQTNYARIYQVTENSQTDLLINSSNSFIITNNIQIIEWPISSNPSTTTTTTTSSDDISISSKLFISNSIFILIFNFCIIYLFF